MESIGSFEAKTHLPALLARVAKGETITITKHGRPIARLVPPDDAPPRMSVEESVAGLVEFRKNHLLGGVRAKDLVEEGRKY
jgi:prevent-host-death family protein